jgi:hypothetical protein
VTSGGFAMSEGRTNVTSMYERSSSGRLPSATASVGLLEPFDSEDWDVDWARPRSSDVSSLTVQTLIAMPSEAATSVRSEFSERVDALREARLEEFGALDAARHLDSLLTGRAGDVVLAVHPDRLGPRLQWRSPDAVVTLAVHSAVSGVFTTAWRTARHAGPRGRSPSTDRVKARALLKSWLAEDSNTSDRSIELLKTELDKDRESSRKLFP